MLQACTLYCIVAKLSYQISRGILKVFTNKPTPRRIIILARFKISKLVYILYMKRNFQPSLFTCLYTLFFTLFSCPIHFFLSLFSLFLCPFSPCLYIQRCTMKLSWTFSPKWYQLQHFLTIYSALQAHNFYVPLHSRIQKGGRTSRMLSSEEVAIVFPCTRN